MAVISPERSAEIANRRRGSSKGVSFDGFQQLLVILRPQPVLYLNHKRSSWQSDLFYKFQIREVNYKNKKGIGLPAGLFDIFVACHSN